jgi:c-di-AMP phosphodiesterase-like protein
MAEIERSMAKTYHTLKKMNRPIRFFGLSSLQLGGLFVLTAIVIVIMITSNTSPIVIVILLAGLLLSFSILFGKLNKEHKKGNPNYMQGLSVQSTTPQKIVDKQKIFSKLIKCPSQY